MACAERLAISVPFLPNVIICEGAKNQLMYIREVMAPSSPLWKRESVAGNPNQNSAICFPLNVYIPAPNDPSTIHDHTHDPPFPPLEPPPLPWAPSSESVHDARVLRRGFCNCTECIKFSMGTKGRGKRTSRALNGGTRSVLAFVA